MSKYQVNISCCLCTESWKQDIHVPDEWATHYDCIDDEKGFCPKHAKVAGFFNDQCPGCVEGWTECELWTAFAYSAMHLTSADMLCISKGSCPRRTNGTFSIKDGQIEHINISDRASSESGQALADAIMEYSEKYHDSPN